MRIAAAQFNPQAGDLAGNAGRIAALARDAAAAGAQLLVTPQGALTGCPCGDLLWHAPFVDAVDEALERLRSATAGLDLHLLVGHPMRAGGARSDGTPSADPDPVPDRCAVQTGATDASRWQPVDGFGASPRMVPDDQPRVALHDAASLLHRGRTIGVFQRQVFSRRDPFGGLRHFRPGAPGTVFTIDDMAFGVLIGEDRHDPERARRWCAGGAQVLLALDAAPFGIGAHCLAPAASPREGSAAATGTEDPGRDPGRADPVPGEAAAPRLVVQPVGAQDEFVFEGGTSARNADGLLVARAPSFEESLLFVDVHRADECASPAMFFELPAPAAATAATASVPVSLPAPAGPGPASVEARIHGALVTGVRDFVRKNGFPGVLLGLSGGIDSALVLAIAVDALGPQRVHAVMMPSPYTADMSREDARAMAGLLGVAYDEIAIDGCFAAFRQTLAGQVPEAGGTTVENLQARIRGTLLMALSNRSGKLVLTAGNKSESAVGYSTLYGDMAGGLAVIKDVYKTMVWRLARWRNRHGIVIPSRIIERPPSAELAPGQLDRDSLPPYETLDAILVRHVERGQGIDEIVAAGFAPDMVRRVADLVRRAEFKRHQSAPGIRVTQRPFDSEWRRFVTCGFSG